jgi:type II secretory pathway predicted ATPase ExeA
MIALGSNRMAEPKSALLSRILSDDKPVPVRKNQMLRMSPVLTAWVKAVASEKKVNMSDVVEAALLLLQQQLENN